MFLILFENPKKMIAAYHLNERMKELFQLMKVYVTFLYFGWVPNPSIWAQTAIFWPMTPLEFVTNQ
jgi:hypothetical protein